MVSAPVLRFRFLTTGRGYRSYTCKAMRWLSWRLLLHGFLMSALVNFVWSIFYDEDDVMGLGFCLRSRRCGDAVIGVNLRAFQHAGPGEDEMIASISKTLAHEYVHFAIGRDDFVPGREVDCEWPLRVMGLDGL